MTFFYIFIMVITFVVLAALQHKYKHLPDYDNENKFFAVTILFIASFLWFLSIPLMFFGGIYIIIGKIVK